MTSSELFLFVGLGNPGTHYEKTRHNLGFLVIRAFANKYGKVFKKDVKFLGETVKFDIEGKEVHLLLPHTYMNRSGEAIKAYMNYFKIPLEKILVVLDDVALPFGKCRLRGWGSSGGHNGLKSVENCLLSNHYKRLRMGIGHPGEKILTDFVLDPFSNEEQKELQQFIDKGIAILENVIRQGFSAAQCNRLTQPK